MSGMWSAIAQDNLCLINVEDHPRHSLCIVVFRRLLGLPTCAFTTSFFAIDYSRLKKIRRRVFFRIIESFLCGGKLFVVGGGFIQVRASLQIIVDPVLLFHKDTLESLGLYESHAKSDVLFLGFASKGKLREWYRFQHEVKGSGLRCSEIVTRVIGVQQSAAAPAEISRLSDTEYLSAVSHTAFVFCAFDGDANKSSGLAAAAIVLNRGVVCLEGTVVYDLLIHHEYFIQRQVGKYLFMTPSSRSHQNLHRSCSRLLEAFSCFTC